METIIAFFISLQERFGDVVFIGISIAISAFLCWVAIPFTTDLMVNHAAGIAGRWFGRDSRTLVINASTNNPEFFSMAVSMGSKRMGGWANPLGSLLANCYLMYFIGLVWVMFVFAVRKDWERLRKLRSLLASERRLIAWHLTVAVGTFLVGFLALRLMQGGFDVQGIMSRGANESTADPVFHPSTGLAMYVSLGLLAIGIVIFFFLETRLKKKRPELFHDIDESEHGHSVFMFLLGTVGLIAACWVMNALFLAWSGLYHDQLASVFGAAVFAGLHYVLGALITSLPELRVATTNYRKLTPADLNTALASASYSNFTNLVLCLIGLAVFIALSWSGYVMPWE